MPNQTESTATSRNSCSWTSLQIHQITLKYSTFFKSVNNPLHPCKLWGVKLGYALEHRIKKNHPFEYMKIYGPIINHTGGRTADGVNSKLKIFTMSHDSADTDYQQQQIQCCARHGNHCYGDFVRMTWIFLCHHMTFKSSSTRNLGSIGSVVLEKS